MKRKLLLKEIPLLKAKLLQWQKDAQGTPLCPICLIPVTMKDALDHDHITGLCRGVLCLNCNGLEGKVYNIANRARRGRPHKEWLGRLILYWIHHETDRTGLYHPSHLNPEQKAVRTKARAKASRARRKKE